MVDLPQGIGIFLEQLAYSVYFWIGIALLALYLVIRGVLIRRKAFIKVFDGELGQVGISRKALYGLVFSICQAHRANMRPSLDLKVKGSRLCLKVFLKAVDDHKIANFAQELQQHLAHALTENLGADQVGSIDIIIKEIQASAAEDL